MAKLTDMRIVDVGVQTQRIAYRAPIKFGGRVVTDAVLLDVTVDVETRGGRRGRGFGSMPVGNVWGWPSRTLTADQTLSAMTTLGERLARQAASYRGTGHPLEITHDLSAGHAAAADEVIRAQGHDEPMPRLAQL